MYLETRHWSTVPVVVGNGYLGAACVGGEVAPGYRAPLYSANHRYRPGMAQVIL